MGLEAATVGIIVGAVGAAGAAYGTIEAQRAGKRQSRAQKEVSDISAAQQKNEQMQQQREQLRQARIRTAQIENSAAIAGVGGSSGESGAVGGVQTITASNIAFGQSTALSAQGISGQNQKAAEAGLSSQINQGIASIGFNAINLGMSMGAGQKLFAENTTDRVSRQLDNTMRANPSLF